MPCRTAGAQKKQRRHAIRCFRRGASYSGACHVPDHIFVHGKIKSALKCQKTRDNAWNVCTTQHTVPAHCPSAKRPTGELKRGAPAESWADTVPDAGVAGSTTEGKAAKAAKLRRPKLCSTLLPSRTKSRGGCLTAVSVHTQHSRPPHTPRPSPHAQQAWQQQQLSPKTQGHSFIRQTNGENLSIRAPCGKRPIRSRCVHT